MASNSGSALEQSVLEAMSLELSDATNRDDAKNNIQDFVNNKRKSHNFTEGEKKFIDKLIAKFDPKMMD